MHLANPDGEFLQLAFQEKLLPTVSRLGGAYGSRSGDDDADAPEKEDEGDELTFVDYCFSVSSCVVCCHLPVVASDFCSRGRLVGQFF